MQCVKCGAENPDTERFCGVCGHKLQSGRQPGAEGAGQGGGEGGAAGQSRRLLDFQGWAGSERGFGPYIEASAYAVVLVAGVAWCLAAGVLWPLYPLIAVLALVAWLRRL